MIKHLNTNYKYTYGYAINRALSSKQCMYEDISILHNDRIELNSIRHTYILH